MTFVDVSIEDLALEERFERHGKKNVPLSITSVAHINNLAGVSSVLAQHQRRMGCHTDTFVFNETSFKQFGGTKINYKSPFSKWLLFRRLRNYDVWHYHYPYGSLKKSLEKRCKGKAYLKHYHGDDLRGKYDDDFCVVSTPDLLQYAPNGYWLPLPVDFDEIELVACPRHRKAAGGGGRENRSIPPLKIGHYPHYDAYKSTDYYGEALAHVEQKMRATVVRIFDLSHQQALEAVHSCDVVVGKIMPDVGWFGKFELEAMALGKPTIGFVSDELYEKYRPPVYRTTKETFKQDLEALLEDETERGRLSKEGIRYVRQHHLAESVTEELQKCYAKLLSCN
jgi:hypothetical protein